jgi:hypothetical protein
MILKNTGGGSSIQLSLFPGALLYAAWEGCEADNPSPTAFALVAVKHLALVRSVLRHEPYNAVARTAFTGVLLPPGRTLELSDALVRPLSARERKFPRLAPIGQEPGYEPIGRRRTAEDDGGEPVVINLGGDLVLEYRFPFRLRLENPEYSGGFPEDMYPPESIDRAAMRLRFSLLMAVERESRTLIVQTWRRHDDPFNIGWSVSWNDRSAGIWLQPTQLTEAEADAWREWYERLRSPHVAKIELALTRILRACGERHDLADILVDAVIAWENLFGTSEGEPTFRITTSLAILLRNSQEERVALRKRLTRIYTLRSKIVHGSDGLGRNDQPLCHEALDIAIVAVRTLVLKRTDILGLADGSERSVHLLLQNSAAASG